MDENTIFQNPTASKSQESPKEPPSTLNTPPQTPQEPAISTPSAYYPPMESFGSSLLLKGVIGIILIGLFIFFFLHVLLPLFTPKNQQVNITYWGLWEEESIMQPILDDFHKQHPTITVEYIKEDIKGYRERLTTRIQNGNGPDVFRFHNTWLPMLSSVLLPIPSDVIQKSDFQKFYYPVVVNDLVQNGAIYGIPMEIDTLSLFANTDLFAAAGLTPPTTWEDFLNASHKLTVPDESGQKIKTSGVALGGFDNITHAPDILSMLFAQNGVNLNNMSQTEQNAVDALNFYTSFASGDSKVWDITLDPSLLAFAKGNLAMYFGYSWDVFTIKSLSPDLKFQILPVPHLPNRNITIASYWVEGASAKSPHKKEALLFLKYLSQKDVEQKLFTQEAKTRLFGEPYSRTDLADLLKDNQLAYPFVSQAQGAVSSYFIDGTFDNGLNSQLNVYLGNAVRSILANTSPQTAVNTLSQGTQQVLKQYGQQ